MNVDSGSDYDQLTTPISERSGLFSQAPPTDMSDTEEDRQRVEMRLKVLLTQVYVSL